MKIIIELIIKNASEVSSSERRKAARWLRQQADLLEKTGAEYDKKYKASN